MMTLKMFCTRSPRTSSSHPPGHPEPADPLLLQGILQLLLLPTASGTSSAVTNASSLCSRGCDYCSCLLSVPENPASVADRIGEIQLLLLSVSESQAVTSAAISSRVSGAPSTASVIIKNLSCQYMI